jgi:uncharacterized protein (DUF1015 family)
MELGVRVYLTKYSNTLPNLYASLERERRERGQYFTASGICHRIYFINDIFLNEISFQYLE